MSAELNLLPCPFCGGTKLRIETNSVQPDNFHTGWVECDDCEARGRNALTLEGWLSSKEEARAEAAAAWNRRAALPVQAPIPTLPTVSVCEAYPPRQQQSPTLPVQAGEGEKNMPPLSQSLLNLIGEYGHARSDRESEVEITYRWLTLIGGIKEYAANVLAAHLKAGGQGGEDGLRAAAMKWWESKRPVGWGVKGHRAHPTVNCADDEECALAIVCATLAKANDGEGA